MSDRPSSGPAITLNPLAPAVTETGLTYSAVTLEIDRDKRIATLTMTGPEPGQPATAEEIQARGDQFWALRAFRELDDVLLRLRVNEPLIGTIVVKTRGDQDAILAMDELLVANKDHWLVREIVNFMKRTLKRMDLTSRSFFAIIEPGSCFAGTLFELALAADRSYMLDSPDETNTIALSAMNGGPLPMSNGLTRLQTRFLAQPEQVDRVLERGEPFEAQDALEAGLVSFTPDDIDWDDEVRLAIESRVALSPDALTAMEANLRFAGPETMETKIFGRLTAWQNWIFQRPNAIGEQGALKLYGSGVSPTFNKERV
jgi:benzoyl-CoA-dihydrodiol lyase